MNRKEHNWRIVSEQIDILKDKFGMGVDKNIRSVLVGLNANGIATISSCGGHVKQGILFPWVLCAPIGRPEYRYINEKIIKNRIIKKYNIISGNIFYPENKEAEKEYYNELHLAKETKEYKKWYLKNIHFKKLTDDIVNEFNKSRKNKNDTRIVFDDRINEGCFIMIPSERTEKKLRKTLSNDELILSLKETQKEMGLFAEFLKDKYYLN